MCVEIGIQIKNMTKNCPNSLVNNLVIEEAQSLGVSEAEGQEGLLVPSQHCQHVWCHCCALLAPLPAAWLPRCLLYGR